MTRFAFALALVAGATFARADAASEGRRAHAVRRDGAVVIDGRLDEPVWASAPRQTDFIQRFPTDGPPASFATTFAVVYDDRALYIGVWADDPTPDGIRALLARRDLDVHADWIAIGIDSYHDRRTAYVFQIDAAGVQRDYLVFDDARTDDTWDAVWTGEVTRTEHGWTAELRIPLNQLRFDAREVQEWGFQVQRFVARTQELSTWSRWPRSAPQIVSKYGVLDGIHQLEPGGRLELLPYGATGLDLPPVAVGDPLNPAVGFRRNAGLDVKYGLGPAFTVSATFNPDFTQVDADPSRINLTGVELHFDEKRPFFLEGIELFKLPIGQLYRNSDPETLFYSRRIGASPPDEPSDARYIRWPTTTTIYSAVKLTGKSTSGWSIGALDAVTGGETAEIVDQAGVRSSPLVTPVTNFAVLRVKRDLNEGNTVVGVAATAVNRALDGTPVAATMHDQAYTGGLQLDHRWAANTWQLKWYGYGSWVHGSESAIAATQQDTIHLLQRPDARDAHFDPTRTSLAGSGASWEFGRSGDTQHWRFGTGGIVRTPGLAVDDLGYQTPTDRFRPYLFTQYHDEQPGEYLLNWRTYDYVYTESTVEPRLKSWGAGGTVNAQLASYWTLGGGIAYNGYRWDPSALRGGPALRVDPKLGSYVQIASDSRLAQRVSASTTYTRGLIDGSSDLEIDVGVTLQVRSNLDVSMGPSWHQRNDPLQYVAGVADMANQFHYVLGRIDQKDASLTMRLNWTLSPHLSLQVYAQPFLATGAYRELKDVDNPHAERFAQRFHLLTPDEYSIANGQVMVNRSGTQYSFAQPDFDLQQLRSTTVLRWEYRPGSTLFAIWSHNRSASADDGGFRLGSDIAALARAQGEDIVAIKLNYWIGL